MKKFLLSVLVLQSFFNYAYGYVSTPLDDSWDYIGDLSNHSLCNFLQRENVGDCFEHYGPANVAKIQCYLYNNTFHMKDFFCVLLSNGAICI